MWRRSVSSLVSPGPRQARAHARQPGQQIAVLGQLHLEPAFGGARPLGENIQDQGASVLHHCPGQLLQSPHLAGGELIVEDDHVGVRRPDELGHLLGLALADEAVGVGGVAVLQHGGGAFAAGGFEQTAELLQGALRGGLLGAEAVGVQPDQHRPVNDMLFHKRLKSDSISYFSG